MGLCMNMCSTFMHCLLWLLWFYGLEGHAFFSRRKRLSEIRKLVLGYPCIGIVIIAALAVAIVNGNIPGVPEAAFHQCPTLRAEERVDLLTDGRPRLIQYLALRAFIVSSSHVIPPQCSF